MDFKTKPLFFVFILLMVSVCAHTQEDIKISVQGIFKDPNGLAVDDGPQTITFRLYNQAQGGELKHEETAPVQVRGGVYSYLLGTEEPLDSSDFNETLYLELTVGDATEPLTPRTQMTYAPYALSVNIAQRAISADSADVAVTAETAQTASRLLSGANSCSGAVGDIKYSILTPDQFVLENGDCWVPMDGRDIPGTKLADDYGWTSVPNMSGLFIRSAEFHETGQDDYDPNRDEDSVVGEYQGDSFQGHTHRTSAGLIYRANLGGGGSGLVAIKTDGGVPQQNDFFISTDGVNGTPRTSSETRPRNRNFYVYIRVN